jgi:hypothetical protein
MYVAIHYSMKWREPQTLYRSMIELFMLYTIIYFVWCMNKFMAFLVFLSFL